MKMDEIKLIAKNMGLDPGKMKKDELIRNIQTKEGNTPCYKSNLPFCDQYSCLWRGDCKPK